MKSRIMQNFKQVWERMNKAEKSIAVRDEKS